MPSFSPSTVPGLFCHVVERLQTRADELGPTLAGRIEHAATHTRDTLAAVGKADQTGRRVIAGLGDSAEQAGAGVPIYGRTPAGEWKTIDPHDIIRKPLFNSSDEVVGIVYPDSEAYLKLNRAMTRRAADETLRTPQAYQVEPAEGDRPETVSIALSRPDEPAPWPDDDFNIVALHGVADGHAFQVNVGPRTQEQPYGERVWLGEKTAARVVTDDLRDDLDASRSDRDLVVSSCDTGAHEASAQAFADHVFDSGKVNGTIHFPTDTGLVGRAALDDGSSQPLYSVVANYDEHGNPLPLWRSIAKSDTPAPPAEP
ncbi:hypothetical protein AB0E01_44430 [Nocardia vinacea]|uniref:hypothetical protein n=1 Tax=Nocardia vinacea TaxID=96468 RepID=UPI0033D07127